MGSAFVAVSQNRLPEPFSGVRPHNRLWEPITSSLYFSK